MAEKTQEQLRIVNQTNFPNNNTNFITPTRLREFNDDVIDSIATTADSASFAAEDINLQGQRDALVVSGSGVVIEEDGITQGTATTLNFAGAVTASVSAGTGLITIPTIAGTNGTSGTSGAAGVDGTNGTNGTSGNDGANGT